MADPGPEPVGTGTSGLLPEDLGEAGVGGPGAEEVAFGARSSSALGLGGAAFYTPWFGLHFPVDTAGIS